MKLNMKYWNLKDFLLGKEKSSIDLVARANELDERAKELEEKLAAKKKIASALNRIDKANREMKKLNPPLWLWNKKAIIFLAIAALVIFIIIVRSC